MKQGQIACGLALCLVLQACSSRPREFQPRLATSGPVPEGFPAAYAECQNLQVQGKLDGSGRMASGAAGAAAGATTAVLGSAAATSAGLYGGGVALASATVVLLPFAIVGGAVGMAKMKRHRREVAIQRVMTGCLAQRGFAVTGWTRPPKTLRNSPDIRP